MDTSERWARIEHLLAGLPGPYGNEQLWTMIRLVGVEDQFACVFAFLTASGVIDSVGSFGRAPQAPQNPGDLTSRMTEVDQDTALATLIGMTSQTLAYRWPGRYKADKAKDVFHTLERVLGYGTRWWTNIDTDLRAWNPVTRHTMDALIVGSGGGVTVAVLAADED